MHRDVFSKLSGPIPLLPIVSVIEPLCIGEKREKDRERERDREEKKTNNSNKRVGVGKQKSFLNTTPG